MIKAVMFVPLINWVFVIVVGCVGLLMGIFLIFVIYKIWKIINENLRYF